MKKILILVIFIFLSNHLNADNLSGYYEMESAFKHDYGSSKYWEFDNIRHYFELKYFANPVTNYDLFLKLGLDSTPFHQNNDNPAEDNWEDFFKSTEAHLKYHQEKWEAILFMRQNRFWFSTPLIGVFNADEIKNYDNAVGIRTDFWDIKNFTGHIIRSDYKNALYGRVEYNLLSKILIGTTLLKSNDTQDNTKDNFVYTGDVQAEVGKLLSGIEPLNSSYLAFETAASKTDGIKNKDNYLYAAEWRDIYFYGVNITLAYHNYKRNFRSFLSKSDEFSQPAKVNEDRLFTRFIYSFPTKAITYTALLEYKNYPVRRAEEVSALNKKHYAYLLYNELYIEFINGFNFKSFFEYKKEWDTRYSNYKEYPTFFAEISVENRIARIKGQVKIRDISTIYQIEAYGVEMGFNITDELKFYTRVINVNQPLGSRQTIFSQLKYDAWTNTDIFLEFGNGDDSNDDLVNDEDFVQYSKTHGISKEIKLFIKLYF